MAALIIGMILWNVYLMKTNSELKKEKSQLEEKYQYLEAFNEVLKYDLTTSRDSVRVLEERIGI